MRFIAPLITVAIGKRSAHSVGDLNFARNRAQMILRGVFDVTQRVNRRNSNRPYRHFNAKCGESGAFRRAVEVIEVGKLSERRDRQGTGCEVMTEPAHDAGLIVLVTGSTRLGLQAEIVTGGTECAREADRKGLRPVCIGHAPVTQVGAPAIFAERLAEHSAIAIKDGHAQLVLASTSGKGKHEACTNLFSDFVILCEVNAIDTGATSQAVPKAGLNLPSTT